MVRDPAPLRLVPGLACGRGRHHLDGPRPSEELGELAARLLGLEVPRIVVGGEGQHRDQCRARQGEGLTDNEAVGALRERREHLEPHGSAGALVAGQRQDAAQAVAHAAHRRFGVVEHSVSGHAQADHPALRHSRALHQVMEGVGVDLQLELVLGRQAGALVAQLVTQ